MTAAKPDSRPIPTPWSVLFVGLTGLLLGIGLVRVGNPVVLDDPAVAVLVRPPIGGPVESSNERYWLLAALALLALPVVRIKPRPPLWLVVLPAIWVGAQFVSALGTVNPALTQATMKHFVGCCLCFYLGLFGLARVARLLPVWIGLGLGFFGVLWYGFDQHFGGLDDTRRYFALYEIPRLPILTPELLKKINSSRIFSTFVYPNAFACGILLVLPLVVGQLTAAFANKRLRVPAGVAAGILVLMAASCLAWTGSKAGWLIAMVQSGVLLWRIPVRTPIRLAVVLGIAAAGLAAFAIRYQGYFTRGATSVSARFDYWEAALRTSRQYPFLGSGPGTFGAVYAKIKRPETEMARLAHNDYLQQLSDSGPAGFLSYFAFVWGGLTWLYRQSQPSAVLRGAWIGLLGWAVHSAVDFGLYIPSLAWTAFLFFGWLCGVCSLGAVQNPRNASTGSPAPAKIRHTP